MEIKNKNNRMAKQINTVAGTIRPLTLRPCDMTSPFFVKMRPMDDPSLGRSVPRTKRPMNDVSL
jgi:hypothetical protein